MKRFRYSLLVILALQLAIGSCHWPRHKALFSATPNHAIFVNRNTLWQHDTIPVSMEDVTDTFCIEKVGTNENDTMLILTDDYIILVFGKYTQGLNDTIILPQSGYSGINFEIIKNERYNLKNDSIIQLGQNTFLRKTKASFNWWEWVLPYMTDTGKGSMIVSGP